MTACTCCERRKPVAERRWLILTYKANHSAFNGYHWTPSAYSALQCVNCQATWRTRAAYVEKLVEFD